MTEKYKRKHDSPALRQLKLKLLAYVAAMVLSIIWIPFWLAPPFDHVTPYIYLALFLSWIPMIWKAYRKFRFDRWLIALILLCSVSSASLISSSKIADISHCHVYSSNPTFMNCVDEGWYTAQFKQLTIGEHPTYIFTYSGSYYFTCCFMF